MKVWRNAFFFFWGGGGIFSQNAAELASSSLVDLVNDLGCNLDRFRLYRSASGRDLNVSLFENKDYFHLQRLQLRLLPTSCLHFCSFLTLWCFFFFFYNKQAGGQECRMKASLTGCARLKPGCGGSPARNAGLCWEPLW